LIFNPRNSSTDSKKCYISNSMDGSEYGKQEKLELGVDRENEAVTK
jgi:hypothetical protein